jgi:hypothetical protein
MSNRAEYAWLTVLLVAAIGVFFYERTEINPDQDHPHNTVTTDDSGLSGMNKSIDDSRPQPLRFANEREDGRGLNQLGMIYLNGTGARRDLSAAFLFLSWAAQAGDVSAMNNLGTMYENGWGTDSDRKKALELYTKAARLGNQLARDNLQRLRATYLGTRTTLLSTRGNRAKATTSPTPLVESSRSGKLNTPSRRGPDMLAARAHVSQATALGSSPDTGGSTGAITLARPIAAQNPAPPRTARLGGAAAKVKAQMNKPARQSPSNVSGGASTVGSGFADPADSLLSQPCVTGNWTGTPRC